MTISPADFGDLIDLAEVLGILRRDSSNNHVFNGDWFGDPGEFISQIFRNPQQRSALLSLIKKLLDGTSEIEVYEGKSWVPIASSNGATVALVIGAHNNDATLSIGFQASTGAKEAAARVLVPMLRIEPTKVSALFGERDGVAVLEGELLVPPPADLISGAALRLEIRTVTNALDPKLKLVLRGLKLPGKNAQDLELDSGSAGNAQPILGAILQQAAAGKSGVAADILALIGLAGDAKIPALPLASIIEGGWTTFRGWLASLFGDDAAIRGWLARLASLIQHGAAAPSPNAPLRLSWKTSANTEIDLDLRVTRPSAAALLIEPIVTARRDALELSISPVRFVLGPEPSLTWVSEVSFSGVKRGLNSGPVKVGALRTGVRFGPDRKPALLIAADDVEIQRPPPLGIARYQTLDLTRVDTLLDLGGDAVSKLVDQIFAPLGAAGSMLRSLLGIAAPMNPWPVPLIQPSELISDPIAAAIAYHRRVLSLHRAGYGDLIGLIRGLIAENGAPSATLGSGTLDKPWRVVLNAGGGPSISIAGWTTSDQLTFALRFDTTVIDLGGGCPRLELAADLALARISLAGGAHRAFPSASITLAFGPRGGGPLEVGDGDEHLSVDRTGLRLQLENGHFEARFIAPNLKIVTSAGATPIELPQVGSNGSFNGAVPWKALQPIAAQLLLRSGNPALERLAELLEWSSDTPNVSLEDLIADPIKAARRLLLALGDRDAARFFSILIGGPATTAATTGLVQGRGDHESPLSIPIAARKVINPGRALDLVFWPNVVRGPQLDSFRSSDLLGALLGGATPPAEHLARGLSQAILDSRDIDELLETRPELAGGLRVLISHWTAGDGLISAAATDLTGAKLYDLDAAHEQLQALVDLEPILGTNVDARTIFVTLEPAWPGLTISNQLALDTPSLAPEAFDVRAARDRDGPWLVRLPPRAGAVSKPGQDPLEQQTLRLLRVIEAVKARAPNGLKIVAFAAAGHAALLAACRSAGTVAQLVTIATPHQGIDLGWIARLPAGDTIELLHSLVPPIDPTRPEHPAVLRGRFLLAPLVHAARNLAAVRDNLAPPATLPAIPGGLVIHSVRGKTSAAAATQAMAGLLVRGLQGGYESERKARGAATPRDGTMGLAARRRAAPQLDHVGVSTQARLSLFGTQKLSFAPELQIRVEIARHGGWLSGGPSVSQNVALRRAVLELDLPLAGSKKARASFVLHEARALGGEKRRWIIGAEDVGADGLIAEARILLGAALAAMTAEAANDPTIRDVIEALLSLGLAERDTKGAISFSVDAVQRWLVEPLGFLRTLQSVDRWAKALAALIGGSSASGPIVSGVIDGLNYSIDLSQKRCTLDARSLVLASGLTLDGELRFDPAGASGKLAVAFGAPGPNGRSRVEVSGAPLQVNLQIEGASAALSQAIVLYPTLDAPALRRLFAAFVPAQLLAAGVTLLRALQPGAVALADPALKAFGLIDGARARLPLVLLNDPGRFFLHPAVLGGANGKIDPNKLAAFVDSIANLAGLATNGPRVWRLGWGAQLKVESGKVSFEANPAAPLPTGVKFSFDFSSAGAPKTEVELSVAKLTATSQTLKLGTIVLIPAGPGLAQLGQQAVTYALAYTLDQLAASGGVVGPAIAGLGDALQLRNAQTKFDQIELEKLAGNPGPETMSRLSRNNGAALGKLQALIGPPLSASGSKISLSLPPFTFDLDAPNAGSLSAGFEIARPSWLIKVRLSSGGLGDLLLRFDRAHQDRFDLEPIAIAPYFELDKGVVQIGLNAAGNRRVVAAFRPAFALEGTPSLGEALIALIVPMAADLVLSRTTVPPRAKLLLSGVALKVQPNKVRFDADLLDVTKLEQKLITLITNAANGEIKVGPLTVALTSNSSGQYVSAALAPGQRHRLAGGTLTVDLELEDGWVDLSPKPSPGLSLRFLQSFAPSFALALSGIGLRIGKSSGPLLDAGFKIETIAMHGLIAFDRSISAAGGQIELGGFRVPVGKAGGDNEVAQGILRDSSAGKEQPRPTLSPALSLIHERGQEVRFDLRAGPGKGPWWVPIQRGFGPVYIEQIGLRSDKNTTTKRIERVGMLLDARVKLLGLNVSVDDLEIGAEWPPAKSGGPKWKADLAGLSVHSEAAGLVLSGGLTKAGASDYVGTVTLRYGVYGLSAIGGYSVQTEPNNDRFTSMFLFGALNAPLGGPPMFFVTGIGAGVGVNRDLILPAIDELPDHPLVRALDRGSDEAKDPQEALKNLRRYFEAKKGNFWLAAGVSFTSFSLVEAVAVLAIEIGDGLDISLMGLARAALPNPSLALAQIELALLARFSTTEGVLWIEAQLTDNSWLLTTDCRLTGGFAFVVWFKGPNAGQFVLTIGGYHPAFKRSDYPAVPRLGFVWNVADVLVIKGESYFALTSEAIMAGVRIEARLEIGPLWAYLRLGADALIYFDPFFFSVSAYAELGAGITIDLDLGFLGHIRITIALHLHAAVLLEGPEFRGRAEIDLGIATASIEFGEFNGKEPDALSGAAFAQKYLTPQGASVLTASPGKGALAPKHAANRKPPVGSSNDPFLLLPEFELAISSTAAVSSIEGPQSLEVGELNSVSLQIGPMRSLSVSSILKIKITRKLDNTSHAVPARVIEGEFPKAVWSKNPRPEERTIPTGDTTPAYAGLVLIGRADPGPLTGEIDYHQVEAGRLPLPLLAEENARLERLEDTNDAETFARSQPATASEILDRARRNMIEGPLGSTMPVEGRMLIEASRRAPPKLLPLTYGMAAAPSPAVVALRVDRQRRVRPERVRSAPRLRAILTAPPAIATRARVRTTVGEAGEGVIRLPAPDLITMRRTLPSKMAADLIFSDRSASIHDSMVRPLRLPFSGRPGAGHELRRTSSNDRPWRAGEIAIFDLSETRELLEIDGKTRIIAIDAGDHILFDRSFDRAQVELPANASRIAILPGAERGDSAGWQSSTTLVQLGVHAFIGPACTLSTSRRVTRRDLPNASTAFISAREVVKDTSIVTTTLSIPARSIALLIDQAKGEPSGEDLDLGLKGARRSKDKTGRVTAPQILAAGARMIAVYSIDPESDETPIEVVVRTSAALHLSGALGSKSSAEKLARELSTRGAEDLFGALISDPSARINIRWAACDPAQQAR